MTKKKDISEEKNISAIKIENPGERGDQPEAEEKRSFSERLKETGTKKAANILTGRVLIVAVLLIIQIVWLVFMLLKLMEYSAGISILFTLISLVATVYIINSNGNPSVKLAWIVPIIEMPLFGGLLYLAFGTKRPLRWMRRALETADQLTHPYVEEDTEVIHRVREEDPHMAGQLQYLADHLYPGYQNTDATYYPLGEDNFQAILEALRQAEHYIFLEYFIVQEGVMWNSILEILKEKAAAGVEVRFIYDDFGSLFKLPTGYDRKLEAMGIKTIVFNPFIPFLSIVMNNRDHRKILVVDGHTAFTGGINLADEYINIHSPFGHWKDTGVRLHGEAVWGLT
ncbi:MAG: PLDc N-terminal domain-containing protein, partial [Lachnospiraceae bacterium]|nr:PLDc N-terminal domain-containing protein [Lachnospiraceae bacterium]